MVLEEYSSGGVTTCDTVEIPSGATRTTTYALSAPARRRATKQPTAPSGKGKVILDNRSTDLLFFEDAPKVLQFNRYIRSGFRARYSYWECAKSVFRMHNETGNIWSHLLPLVVWVTMMATGLLEPWEPATGLFYVVNFTVFCCLTGSVCYHTFMGCDCHYNRWLTLDVFGVYVVILGSQWAALRSTFACYPNARICAEVAYYSVGALGVVYAAAAKSPKQRGLPLLGLWLLRVGCLASRPVLGGARVQSFYLYVLGEGCAVVGGVVNVARFPERFFQGARKPKTRALLDYWLNSHQLMHILTLGTLITTYIGLKWDMEFHKDPAAQCLI
ncbi:hypothetical protein BSKO_12201 [Bryopsis sp. KO-2023]|nr:hypothetical protein BSKO_12201 [Bryopsis sp. KO-2023]